MAKLAYKPLSILASALGGLLASMLFHVVWKAVTHDEQPPQATQRERRWSDILAGAALQGALFGMVKAVLDRASARGVEQTTGSWPGE
jgi:hypothetical protein